MISIRADLAAVPVLVCLAAAPTTATAATRIASPLTAVAAAPAGPVTTLALDAAAIEQLRQVDAVTFAGFPLDANTTVDLELRRFEVLTPDADIVVHTDDGVVHAAPPQMTLLRGHVAGRPHSRVFLSLTPRGANGYVHIGGDQYIIAGASPGRDRPTVIYDLQRLPAGALDIRPFECGTADVLPAFNRAAAAAAPGPPAAALAGEASCETDATVAIETDWEFTESFGGDTEASGAYALTLMAAVSSIYVTDDPDDNEVGIGLAVSALSLWDTVNDPWSATTTQGLLEEFRSLWNSTQGDIERNTAHFMTSRALSGAGGLGYLPGLCQGEWAYAISTQLQGSFPVPLEIDGGPQNWDLVVVAHELGHNFGAPHTHAMDPPVDECAYGVCPIDPDTEMVEGTLMSYCHLCDGGIANINLWFHDRTLDEWIHPYLETGLPCTLGIEPTEITNQPDSQVRCEGDPVSFFVTVSAAVPVDYQWRHNTVDIPNATSSSYSIPAVGPADFGTYDVMVSTTCEMLQSDPAQLTPAANCDPGGNPCPADLNGDDFVGINDFLTLLSMWGTDPGGPPDFNDDNIVGINDFLFLLANWGPC